MRPEKRGRSPYFGRARLPKGLNIVHLSFLRISLFDINDSRCLPMSFHRSTSDRQDSWSVR